MQWNDTPTDWQKAREKRKYTNKYMGQQGNLRAMIEIFIITILHTVDVPRKKTD